VKKKIESIQALRALAAFLVVFLHAQHQVLGYRDRGSSGAFLNSNPTMLLFGEVGVDIFFVISGVVMTLTVWNLFSIPKQAGVFLDSVVNRLTNL
jgi:exopolysaccharide production protein ExoZ